MKKTFRIIPLLVLAPLAQAQEVDITGASGFVAPLTITFTLSETTGGYAISPSKKESHAAKGVTYPDFSTFQTTYEPDSPLSTIVNPFGWNDSAGNHYVEKVTTNAKRPAAPVVTATGSFKIAKTRYTNATLLSDLAAAGEISSTTGYRLVAVRFNVAGDSHYQTPNHLTDVNTSYYFFAERGPTDPAPIYLGAERDEMFRDEKFIAFTRRATAKSGGYVDTFTGNSVENRYDYALKSESYKGSTLADFTFFRPVEENAFYLIDASGLLGWSERYDTRKQVMAPGAFSGSRFIGEAQGHSYAEGSGYTPTRTHRAVASGSVKFGAVTFHESMTKYLDQLPGTMETHGEESE